MFTLRPYQNRACNAVEKAFASGDFQRVLLVLATGDGKTVVFSRLTRHWINEQGARVLILADRDELIAQAVAKLYRAAGLIAAVEKAEQRASPGSPLVVSSIQTMCRRLAKWRPGSFSHIICDEAHLSLASNWQTVLRHFCGYPAVGAVDRDDAPRLFGCNGSAQAVCVLGVTATPFRADKRELGAFYETVAYEHTCFDSIGEGYLAPIKVRTLPVSIALDGVAVKKGDFEEKGVADAISPLFEQIVDAIKRYAPRRRILAFHPLIVTSEKFVAVCNARGLSARHIDGNTGDRAALLAAFAREDCPFQLLSNSSLLTTGVDIERIDAILNLRLTKSATLYQQIIGRGTRVLPGTIDGLATPEERRAAIAASAKPDCLILDPLVQYEKLGLQRPANLFAKTEEEARAITKRLEAGAEGDEELDLIGTGMDVAADREGALRQALLARAKCRSRFFDAAVFAAAAGDEGRELLAYEPLTRREQRPPTPRQMGFLAGKGIDDIRTFGQASRTIELIVGRSKRELATPRQLRQLVRFGVEHAEAVTFKEATPLLDKFLAPKAPCPSSAPVP